MAVLSQSRVRQQSLVWIGALFTVVLLLLVHHGDCKNRRNKGSDMDELETGNDLNSNAYNDEEGDVSSDESLIKGRDSGWDPSFLDILSSDYFDESATPNKQIKKNQDSFIAIDDESTLPNPETVDASVVEDAPSDVAEDEAVTSKAPCSGCPTEVNPKDPKINDIAAFAFQQHLNSLEDSELGLHLLEIIKARTQIVAGQKYTLDIKVAYSNCSKLDLFGKQAICAANPEKESFICTFDVLEQKWKNHTELLLTKCDEVQPGGEQEDEVEQRDPEEAEARLGELDGTGEETDAPTTTTIASSSDVAYTDGQKQRKKRDTNKTVGLGGLRDAEEDKNTLMELARFGVEQLDIIDEDNDARLVVDILSAKKQTISGWLYHLKVRVAQTTCEEGSEVTLETCKDKIVPPYSICNIKILFQPWQTVQKKVTESQCSQEKTKKGKKLGKQYHFQKKDSQSNPSDAVVSEKALLGGFSPVNPESEDLLQLSEFILTSLDAQSNAMHAQRLIRVIEAQRQIVSGVKTKMLIELGYTKCRKSKELERNKCDIDETRDHNYCSVTVWEQPWVNSKKVTQSKCGRKEELYGSGERDDDARRRRSSPMYPGLQTPSSAGVIVSDSSLDLDEKKFRAFMIQHDKAYNTNEEYQHRLGIFKTSLQKIKLLQEYEEGTATYGVTKFADLTEEEYSKHFLGLRPDLKRKQKTPKPAHIPQLPRLPDEFDWRNFNAVTPVKNQGLCGSCWAFSVTGNVEGLYALKHKSLVSFSEQELVDCDTLDEGCNGGLPENAYKILQKIGGLETESEYPYEGRNENCAFNATKAQAKVKGYVELPKNETEIAMWLTKNGPISIGINANAMQFYWGGVSKPWKFLCSPKSLDHGVLIVGYGVHTYPRFNRTLPYWSIKNSWGLTWGEQGYYRVYRGANTCGVAEMATSATIF